MKKILALMAAATTAFAFMPTSAEAGHGSYPSKIHSRCGSCSGNVYAYYRPVRTCGTRLIYGWVPSYHSNCGHSHGYRSYGSSYRSYGSRGGVSIHFGVRSTPSYYNRGYSSGYRSYGYGSRGYGRSCR